MRNHPTRRWGVALVLGTLLLVAPTLGQESKDPEKAEPGGGEKPALAKPHLYKDATLAAFEKLLATPEWKPADPPHNPQGMLEASHEKTGLTFVLVPAGTFMMGSHVDENSRPVHPVGVRAFLIAKTECPQRVWDKLDEGHDRQWRGPDLPIESIAWSVARSWCHKVSLRLPSESEWEYACRAGTSSRFHSGEEVGSLAGYANIADAFLREHPDLVPHDISKWNLCEEVNDGFAGTAPVGSFLPNPWGLLDMHGNLAEWCEDRFHKNYEGAPTDSRAWTDTGSAWRLVRGGCWRGDARMAAAWYRIAWVPFGGRDFIGFRPAADLPE